MTTDELREAVARAIWEARESGFPGRVRMRWEDGTDLARRATMADADAALRVVREAMREPSEAMVTASRDARPLREDDSSAAPEFDQNSRTTWRAMFDASPLGEPEA